jgi:hypothetical protein
MIYSVAYSLQKALHKIYNYKNYRQLSMEQKRLKLSQDLTYKTTKYEYSNKICC